MDAIISAIDNALRTLSGASSAGRPCPGSLSAAIDLDEDQRKLSGSLMRVNHVGEVCAQALYNAQALSARGNELKAQLESAAREESDHLAWTEQRLSELGARPSLLNPIWYGASFAIGLLAGKLGDAQSLGFVVETERQVERHLEGHLDRLPAQDATSRAIVRQMKEDEARHADAALRAGAAPMPAPLRWAMRAAARVMTTTAHYI